MNEDHELSHLEKEWKNSFDRFTAPEPSREQTLNLIRKIKETGENKPVDLRADSGSTTRNAIILIKSGQFIFISMEFSRCT